MKVKNIFTYLILFSFRNFIKLFNLLFYLISLDGPLPSVLQEVSVPVINNTVCESMYRNAGFIEHIPHIFICAGWRKGGFDSCEVKIIYFIIYFNFIYA